MRVTASTDIGMRHEQNQDCYKVGRLKDDSYWAVLCDGMGGVSSGGEASFIAVNYLEQMIDEMLLGLTDQKQIKQFMYDSTKKCNDLIFKLGNDMNRSLAMGTTLVMAIVRNDKAQIIHAGDSRAYHISNRNISRLTIDHSVVQELLMSGSINEQQAKSHPNRNIITSALGIEPELKLDYNEVKLLKGEYLLLCTDGLNNMVTDHEMVDIIRSSEFYRTTDNLIKRALELGGFDNVTAVLLQAE